MNTDRIERIKKTVMVDHYPICIEKFRITLDVREQTRNDSVLIQRGKILKACAERMPIAIGDDELIVGIASSKHMGLEIDPDYGMIVAVQTMVGNSWLFKLICVAFLITLFANMASWSFGVNSVAAYAAQTGNMPKVFGKMNPKTGMPDGAAITNGVVASLVLCIQLVPVKAISDGIFWMLFSLSVVFLLLTYVPMFPAFMNLRKNDPNRERVYKMPFKGGLLKAAMIVPMIELVGVIITTVVPLSADEVSSKMPMLIGFFVLLAIGEVVRVVSAKGRTEEYHGLTPELAQKRLEEEAAAEPAE